MFIDNLVLNLKLIYHNPVLVTIITCFLLFNAITDYKYHLIYNKSNLLLLISRIIFGISIIPLPYSLNLNINNIYGLFIGGLIILIPAVIFIFCAGGDIKLMAVIGFFLGIYVLIPIASLSILLYFSYIIFMYIKNKKNINKKKEYPFAPFVFISNIILLILSYLL